jgi:hypothetical protein
MQPLTGLRLVKTVKYPCGCLGFCTRYWMLDTGYWIQDARYWIIDNRYWIESEEKLKIMI